MKVTYAYNGFIIGILLGILVMATTDSLVLGIIVGLVASAAACGLIRLIEIAIGKGVDKLGDRAYEVYQTHKEQKAQATAAQTQYDAQPNAQLPTMATPSEKVCPICGKALYTDSAFCTACGSKIK